ncbi:hypothetical protein [Streptomyces syringium]|uniref:hypothetical protein n=1 Tax=Streptomyces syringium TaxID=76729 RepID=UPI003407CBF3
MTSANEEIAEQQASITSLLLHHVHAPLAGGQFLRGVLPVPPSAEAVRIVTGPANTHNPGGLTAYEMPLRRGGGLLTAYDITGILRALLAETYSSPSRRIGAVMGMKLVHVELRTVTPTAATSDDDALRILRTLTFPNTEKRPTTRLRGFLFTARDRLRLYLDISNSPDVIAADVRMSGAVTALVTALPTLIREDERKKDSSDPHCSSQIDLTRW